MIKIILLLFDTKIILLIAFSGSFDTRNICKTSKIKMALFMSISVTNLLTISILSSGVIWSVVSPVVYFFG